MINATSISKLESLLVSNILYNSNIMWCELNHSHDPSAYDGTFRLQFFILFHNISNLSNFSF